MGAWARCGVGAMRRGRDGAMRDGAMRDGAMRDGRDGRDGVYPSVIYDALSMGFTHG